jgi:hypothetical protein
MAFTNAQLVNIYSGPNGYGVYVYKSDTDTRETVMASGYFNNSDDDLALAVDDMIFVTGDQGGYCLRVDSISSGAVNTELGAGSGPIYVRGSIADIAATTSSWAISPCDGIISRIWSVLSGSVDVDTTIGLELAGVDVTDGASAALITITAAGSAAGDIDFGTADAANAVSEGSAIEITCGGEGASTGIVEVLIEILPV